MYEAMLFRYYDAFYILRCFLDTTMLFRGITSLIQIFANNHNKTEIQLEWGEWTTTRAH